MTIPDLRGFNFNCTPAEMNELLPQLGVGWPRLAPFGDPHSYRSWVNPPTLGSAPVIFRSLDHCFVSRAASELLQAPFVDHAVDVE